MIFQRSVTSFFFFSLQLASLATCKSIKQKYHHPDVQEKNISPHMSLVEFQSMLYSEINSEIEILQQEDSPHYSASNYHDQRL